MTALDVVSAIRAIGVAVWSTAGRVRVGGALPRELRDALSGRIREVADVLLDEPAGAVGVPPAPWVSEGRSCPWRSPKDLAGSERPRVVPLGHWLAGSDF